MAKSTLDPETRLLYGDSLKAPFGYEFDGGIATTFSMDFETALAVPVSLALFSSKSRDEILEDPVTLLESAERTAEKLVVYVDAGQIHADVRQGSRLASLLEKAVVEVKAPNEGSFHPKLWALRFKPLDRDLPMRMRLLILSRNLTRDRSWDAAMCLDGERGTKPFASNKPLHDLLAALPGMAVGKIQDTRRALTLAIANDLRYVNWDRPPGCDAMEFHVNGVGSHGWKPSLSKRIAIMSPFVEPGALKYLADLADQAPKLISRPDQLVCLPADVLDRFREVAVLDEMAETEDGEEPYRNEQQGLHAKIFIQEDGRDVRLTLGSGNATNSALLPGGRATSNVEVFATLHGLRRHLGGIDEILGETGFGRMTRTYQPDEVEPPDPADVSADQNLLQARRALARGALSLRCEAKEEDGAKRWKLWLVPPKGGLRLDKLGRVRAWPITLGEGHARDALAGIRSGSPIDLGTTALVDLTSFIAIEITDQATRRTELFSTGMTVEGMPEERDLAILNHVIDSRQKFMAYLRLLLASYIDQPLPPLGQNGKGKGFWGSGAADAPLFEDLVRALCAGDGRLATVDRLIRRLSPKTDAVAEDRVPAEFKELWQVFRTVMEASDAR
ncbi:phospholipase D family protein [Rhizobium sp. SIMBA_035]